MNTCIGVLIDDAAGDHITDTIYNDADPDQIETLADTQPHRNVDLELLKADKEGTSQPPLVLIILAHIYQAMSRFTSYFPLRSMGLPLVNWLTAGSRTLILSKCLGLSGSHCAEVELVWWGQAKTCGQMSTLKKVRIMATVLVPHTKMYYSVADLYTVLYDSIIVNPATGHGREGMYFGVNGEHSLYAVGKAIGEALVAIGKADNPEPTSFTQEEIQKYFQVCNYSRFVPEQSDEGWFRGRRFLGQTLAL